ncbi:MAG: hypothetical protein QNK19_08910 [Xanthomonadales bacterium]|nr:hypothetical protein [Xanthomonadales bacterium]
MSNTRFRIIPAIDQSPALVQLAQHAGGKALLLAVFAFGLFLHGSRWWPELVVILAAMSFWPQFRRPLLTAATLYWLFSQHTNLKWSLLKKVFDTQGLATTTSLPAYGLSLVVATILFCAMYYYLVRRSQGTWLYRRPVATLLLGYIVCLTFASYAPLPATQQAWLWGFLIMLGHYFWYLAYSLHDRNAASDTKLPGTNFIYQFGHYQPFWGGSNTPFPKGATYLRKIEAKNAEQLAISQLKGIKLLYWAFILSLVLGILKMVVYGRPFYNLALPFHLVIPSVNDALAHTRAGEPYHWYINWAVMLIDFTKAMLTLSIWGHIIIATVRMAGFKALRNTWSPLQSKSIAEFWNRYYYYFKELLVEFFFYPTFLKYFKTRPRLRLFMATMAAAGLGNMLYHFIRDIHVIMGLGIWGALKAFHVYIFYSLLLGTAIGLSQIRNQRRKQSTHWFRRNITAPATVLGFYAICHVFGAPYSGYGLDVYFQFLLNMINIGV